MEEIWKDIEGYEGLYQVSNLGRVKTLGGRWGIIKVMKPSSDKRGYQRVILCKEKQHKTYLVHRLVATAFLPNPDSLPYIDHINTVTSDNCVENIRWVNQLDNLSNILTKSNMSKSAIGSKKGKRSDEHRRHLSEALKGRVPKMKGMHWKLVDGKRVYY